MGFSATRFTRFYAADGAQTRIEPDVGTNVCTYAPAYRNTPLAGTLPGTSYNFSSTITCVTSGTSSSCCRHVRCRRVDHAAHRWYFHRGQVQLSRHHDWHHGCHDRRDHLLDRHRHGPPAEVRHDIQFVPAGQTSPTNVRATAFVLSAYQRVGSAPVGDTRQGLVGKWDILDTGGGVCEGTLAAGGVYSGNCTRGNTTFTGSVDNTGHMNGTTSDGTTITGTLDSPISGNGSVTGPGGTFTWTARRR